MGKPLEFDKALPLSTRARNVLKNASHDRMFGDIVELYDILQNDPDRFGRLPYCGGKTLKELQSFDWKNSGLATPDDVTRMGDTKTARGLLQDQIAEATAQRRFWNARYKELMAQAKAHKQPT